MFHALMNNLYVQVWYVYMHTTIRTEFIIQQSVTDLSLRLFSLI